METPEAGAGSAEMTAAMLAEMTISTDDSVAAEPAAGEPASGEPTASAENGDEAKPPRRARVAWGENGGFHIQPGEGVQVDEDGKIVLDGEVVKRIASKRIGQAHEKEKAAREEAAAARERAAALEAELQALRAGKPPAPADDGEEPPADKPWAAKGAKAPVLEDFETVEAWADARDEWKEAQRAPAARQPAARPADADGVATEMTEGRKAALLAAVEAGKAKHGDGFLDAVKDVPLPPEMFDAVLESDYGADVLLYLGEHPDEAADLAALSGKPLLRAIAKIEARLEDSDAGHETGDDAASADATTGEEATPPRAPAPKHVPTISPVRAGSAPRRDPVALAAAEDKSGLFAYLDQLEGRAS